jgi:membrane associated rhomboid family serine protease
MIPLRDNVPTRSFPVVNIAILVLNVLVFLFEISLSGPAQEAFLIAFAVVPARLLSPPVFGDWHTLLTSQFLHGGLLHLGSNMLALFIFGDNVEDRLGHLRFLVFYLLCGVAGALLHVYVDPTSPVPALGASGAIAGVLGGYMVLFPSARVLTFVPIFVIPWVIGVPAALWAIGWFLSQLLGGFAALGEGAEGGVGFWAHVGGFVAGLTLVWPLRRRDYVPLPTTR